MKLVKYEKPLFVEELVFQIAPDKLEAYLEADFAIFTKGLEQYEGFCGSEIWVSSKTPGLVRNIVFWESFAAFQAVDGNWVQQADARLKAQVGEKNMRFIEEAHKACPMEKIREYHK